MKELNKNWDKVLFGVLLCVFLVVIFTFAGKNASNRDYNAGVSEDLNQSDYSSLPVSRMPGNAQNIMLEKMKSDLTIKIKPERDIFAYPREKKDEPTRILTQEPVFEVVEIGYKPLGIEYKGKIVFGKGEIAAQINMRNKSYIARVNSTIAQYTVTQLNEQAISLRDGNGKVITIKYRENVYSDQLSAKIKELNSQKTFDVGKDSEFLGIKVLDIDGNSVLVSKSGERLRLEKGMVHK